MRVTLLLRLLGLASSTLACDCGAAFVFEFEVSSGILLGLGFLALTKRRIRFPMAQFQLKMHLLQMSTLVWRTLKDKSMTALFHIYVAFPAVARTLPSTSNFGVGAETERQLLCG